MTTSSEPTFSHLPFALAAGLAAAMWSGEASALAPDEGATKEGAAEPAGPKVLVLPYQPIFRSVEQDKALQATGFLTEILGNQDDMVMVRGGIADRDEGEVNLDGADAAREKADQAEGELRIRDALLARQEVIDELEKNASAIEKAETFILAHHHLARAQMWAGDDDAAKETLEAAARMAPGFELAPEAFSRMYRRWFAAAAKRVLAEKPGELLVKSVLPGATIYLDGREMDVAPVLLQEAVPGKHLLGAEVEGVPAYKTVVTVPSGKKAQFRVAFGGTVGGAAVGEVADAIAENAMNKAAVKAAVKAGKDVGAAYVVAGGMSKGEDSFNVHTFVVNVKTGQVQPLEVVNLDFELLTAEADIIRVVRQVEDAMESFSAPKPMVAMIDSGVRGTTTINEVEAKPRFDGEPRRTRSSTKKKTGRRTVFKPLKKTKIEIKDEEE